MKLKFDIDIGLLILRLSSAGMMLFGHGWMKFLNLSTGVTKFPDPLGIGSTFSLILTVFAEFFCSLLIMVGFKTRLASIPLLATMLVAAFVVHGGDPWKKKEFALLYGLQFAALIFTGAGKFSIDQFTKSRN
jgi:putative oxidoreductase